MFRIIFSFALLFLASCARTVYVPQVENHVEYRDRVKLDSVFLHDSVFVLLRQDTVYIHRDRWRETIRIRRDTVFLRDSIPYPVEIEKSVIPKGFKWGFLILIIVVLLIKVVF